MIYGIGCVSIVTWVFHNCDTYGNPSIVYHIAVICLPRRWTTTWGAWEWAWTWWWWARRAGWRAGTRRARWKRTGWGTGTAAWWAWRGWWTTTTWWTRRRWWWRRTRWARWGRAGRWATTTTAARGWWTGETWWWTWTGGAIKKFQ